MSNIVNRYEDILKDKALWKVCESVHLNMDTVFLPSEHDEKWLRARIDGEYCFDSLQTINVDQKTAQYVIRRECFKYVKDNVLPRLPFHWWREEQPWMSCSNQPGATKTR